jgi:uncharacterized protein YjbI with pentapeptide repeats
MLKVKILASTFLLVLLTVSSSTIIYWAFSPSLAPAWTGFSGSPSPIIGVPPKTLWDWLDLLIIPIVIAVSVWFLNRSETRKERQIAQIRYDTAQERLHDETLQKYYDKMAELLLKHNLRDSESEYDEVRSVARATTLAVLRMLDGKRKADVLKFLYASDLINENNVIPLRTANFTSTQLSNSRFSHSHLNGTDLEGSVLDNCYFIACTLTKARFDRSSLHEVRLQNCNIQLGQFSECEMSRLDFWESNLDLAQFNKARLTDCHFHNAIITGGDFVGATIADSSFEGANLMRAKFSQATLNNVSFRDAILVRADFTGVDLRKVDLTGADLAWAILEEVKLTDTQRKMFAG